MELEQALRESWTELLGWVQQNRFKPENEEDIQSFLYYGLVTRLQDATLVKPKRTTGKPPKLVFSDGQLLVGDMHFPDLLIGTNGEIVVEIKFMREQRARSIFSGCKSDIEKMRKHHDGRKRFFVLYDVCAETIFLSTSQKIALQVIDPDCVLMMYPLAFNDSRQKQAADKARLTLIAKEYDHSKQGKLNAAKAIGKKPSPSVENEIELIADFVRGNSDPVKI